MRTAKRRDGDMAETELMRKRARDERADGCEGEHGEPGRAASPGGARQCVALAVSDRKQKNSGRLPCARHGARAVHRAAGPGGRNMWLRGKCRHMVGILTRFAWGVQVEQTPLTPTGASEAETVLDNEPAAAGDK